MRVRTDVICPPSLMKSVQTDNDGEPVNVDQELATEASLRKWEPVSSEVHASYK